MKVQKREASGRSVVFRYLEFEKRRSASEIVVGKELGQRRRLTDVAPDKSENAANE